MDSSAIKYLELKWHMVNRRRNLQLRLSKYFVEFEKIWQRAQYSI
jgi:hypothetical protein